MADVKELRARRGQQKAVLKRTSKFLQNEGLQVSDVHTKIELEMRLQTLRTAFDTFNKIQNEVEIREEVPDETEREEFESLYFELCAKIKGLLQTDNETGSEQVAYTVKNPPTDGVNASRNPYIIPQVHLPTSKLPQYSGEYGKWVEFRDCFQALVDRNPIITDVQKLYYLRSCLSPSVLETIQSIPITAANYKLAWDTLKNRYEKSQLIRQSHVKAILKLPRLHKESAKDLRRFFNEFNNNLESLRNLHEPVEHWDLLLMAVIVEKLDPGTQREWEKYSTVQESVTVQDLLRVLSTRCEVLERLENNQQLQVKSKHKSSQMVHVSQTVRPVECLMCKGNHQLYYCEKFLHFSPRQRRDQVKRMKLCVSCLGPHFVLQCKSKSTCKQCGQRHNTLLHEESPQRQAETEPVTSAETASETVSNTTVSDRRQSTDVQVHSLLSTAVVVVQDAHGNKHECRALLDCGAMSNFITKRLMDTLGLNAKPVQCRVSGIGSSTQVTNQMVPLNFKSRINSFARTINCLVMDNITSNIPCSSFSRNSLKFPRQVQLADPEFNQSKPIDLLLGSAVFWETQLPDRNRIPNTKVIIQNTQLGWILGGYLSLPQNIMKSISCVAGSENLENQMAKFWQIDQVPELAADIDPTDPGEQIFRKTVKRSEDGKFVVTIPFKETVSQLGQSKERAKQRFLSLERRLLRNPTLRSEYTNFMREYIEMNHMQLIPDTEVEEELNYFIPHHWVCREDSLTTKLRVVFNASMKSDSGLSLNDVQYPGPVIQNDLTVILMNFRAHRYVMTADISKMYRMIWINSQQTRFQRIFWREHPTEPLQCYELNTVTYGTASAPFLAIRCLHQLGIENQQKYPEASHVIKNNFYVDDLVCGAESEEKLIQLQTQVTDILQGAGFELRKWLTNESSLYDKFSINTKLECATLVFGSKEAKKTLGVAWNATTDTIHFLSTQGNRTEITKRTILSEIAKLFDPLGLLGPIVVVGKLMIQELWKANLDWDDEVSSPFVEKWQKFRLDLALVQSIQIPRHVVRPQAERVELHGFGDASEIAYGAAIYLVSKANSRVSSHLLCSRSRVAPLKQRSLPRLELCAALLTAQLAAKAVKSLEIVVDQCYYWSDSTITLSWIRACPSNWKTFVANRVAEIQRLTEVKDWHHVASADNPADVLSRGCAVQKLIDSHLWWHGPEWIIEQTYPNQSDNSPPDETFVEARQNINTCVNVQVADWDILERFSTLSRLKRVVAYIRRFHQNCKVPTSSRETGELNVNELQGALTALISREQKIHLVKEYNELNQGKFIKPQSSLFSLKPFLHSDDLIRVGGRITNSFHAFNKKHPVILPKDSKLTRLIFEHFHKIHFHCGPTQLLATVREEFWPISGRQAAKKIVRNCNVCFLAQPKTRPYQMGDLPAARITQSFPFLHVGIDYAGPFQIKDRITRNPKILKSYVCLFVCFSTKAIHLEVVSDLTTTCFLDAFKRFVSRRGKPSHVYSDNARTFVGAHTEIRDVYKFLAQSNKTIQRHLSEDHIQWHFIPPRAPHFGGIWEAGVKSVKYHLKRTMKNHKFTFEQFSTILCQIEAILNSRPLTPLTSTCDSHEPLTPGHFLILRPPTSMTTAPELQSDQGLTSIKQFRVIEQVVSHFWSRWHKEYLAELQRRGKWQQRTDRQIKVGDIAVIKEDGTPVMKWPLAKVVEVHPGQDGTIRVVTVKMDGSLKRRPVTKLCVLPTA